VAAVGRRPVGSAGALVAGSAAIGRRSRCSSTGGGGGAVGRSREWRNTLCGSCGSFGGAAAGGCPRDWWTVYLVCAVLLRSPRGRTSWARTCTSLRLCGTLRMRCACSSGRGCLRGVLVLFLVVPQWASCAFPCTSGRRPGTVRKRSSSRGRRYLCWCLCSCSSSSVRWGLGWCSCSCS